MQLRVLFRPQLPAVALFHRSGAGTERYEELVSAVVSQQRRSASPLLVVVGFCFSLWPDGVTEKGR